MAASSPKDEFHVNIVQFDPLTNKFNDLIRLDCPIVNQHVTPSKCARNFKQRLATILPKDAFGPDINQPFDHNFSRQSIVAIIKNGKVKQMSLPNPNTEWDEIIRTYKIVSGDTIYFHDTKTTETTLYGSSFINKLQDIAANIEIIYNKLATDSLQNINELYHHIHVKYDQIINVDNRMRLSELREIMRNALNINKCFCTIKNGNNGIQLKDDNKSLIEYDIQNGDKLFIEHKKPLKPNQYIIRIYVQKEIGQRCLVWGYCSKIFEDKDGYIIPLVILNLIFDFYYFQDETASLIFVGCIILEKQWKMNRIKNEIALEFYPKVPIAKYQRIRNFMSTNTLRGIYYETKTLYENVRGSLMDNAKICCQRTLHHEMLTKKHVLIKLIRCNISRKSFGKIIEMSFFKKCKLLTEFKQILSELSDIDISNIGISRISSMQLKSVDFVEKFFKESDGQNSRYRIPDGINMWNEDKLTIHSTLGGAPWFQRNGDIVAYVDKTEYN